MEMTIEERQALSHANGNAALDACLALLKTDREAVRAAYWNRLPLAVRRVAVMSANLPKERAEDTLNKFTALERGRVNISVQRLIKDLQDIGRCMQCGDIPTPNDNNFH